MGRRRWADVKSKLQSRIRCLKDQDIEDCKLLQKALAVLNSIPWAGDLKGVRTSSKMDTLAFYLTQEWLTDDHIHHMLDLVNQRILNPGCILHENTWVINTIKEASAEPSEHQSRQSYAWLRRIGDFLTDGLVNEFGFVMNLGNCHWVACVLDFRASSILYGDSLRKPMPEETKNALLW